MCEEKDCIILLSYFLIAICNSFLDTLPTKNNLSCWGKRSNTKCDLCGRKETLQHVLNNCRIVLDQWRYTWRHNSVLRIILDTLQDVISTSLWKIYCDLKEASKIAGTTIPPDILPTQQRPDLVLLIQPQSLLLLLSSLFRTNKTSIQPTTANLTNMLVSPVIWENRVMTSS